MITSFIMGDVRGTIPVSFQGRLQWFVTVNCSAGSDAGCAIISTKLAPEA
jgi:hypothetical protein